MIRAPLACVLALLIGAPAFAQDFFGTGKPPTFKEEDIDRRFARSKLGKMLTSGTADPNCAQVVGALLTVVAEVGPTLHKRDAEFSMDNTLLQALLTQVQNPRFPAAAYLTAMIRRVQIDRKLPDDWLLTATAVNSVVKIIDLSKLRFLNEGLQPIDSFVFTLEALRAQHELEVKRATSVSTTSATEFRDKYLDREVAWGRLAVLDIIPDSKQCPKSSGGGKKKGGKASRHFDAGSALVACLELIPQKSDDDPMQFQANMMKMMGPRPKPITVIVKAKLADKQYIDLEKLPGGTRVMVRGRLWEMNKTVTELDVRDAVLFIDRDWSQGTVLADPNAIAQCPAAINELSGTASGAAQPGGFGKHY